jgi:small GTP-binding protein
VIRDLFIIKMPEQRTVFHQSYSRTPVDENTVIGFIGAMSMMILSVPEEFVATIPAGNYKLTYAHMQGYIYVVCSDVNDNEADLQKKLKLTIEKINSRFISLLREESNLKDRHDEIAESVDKFLVGEIKVALVGFGGVGKSTIFGLIQGHDVPVKFIQTTPVIYKRLDNKIAETEVIICDYTGQERFTSSWPTLLKGTHVILLVTDSTVENVLETKRMFINMIKKNRPDAIIVIIGNKQDLPKAMGIPLLKKMLAMDDIYSTCAVDPTERKKIQNIVIHGVEKFLAKQTEREIQSDVVSNALKKLK